MSVAAAELQTMSAVAVAAAVRTQRISARAVALAALARIESLDSRYNCCTAVTRARALAAADRIDAALAAGAAVGPLAGVPYAVKNLFDVEGLATLAGSRINRERPPAVEDATLVRRMDAAGAVLVAALNMDEYAYGFTTENEHYGATRNPHDTARVAGGSSGGSAAALAAGLVPLTLASDTNGSIRVPAALSGVFGLKPTFGRLSRRGAFPFVASLDHLGPLARSTADLALAYDVLQGEDRLDAAQVARPYEPASAQLQRGADGLRLALADDHFARNTGPEAQAALQRAAAALGVTRTVTLPEAARARAAAYVITMAEGGNLHFADLKSRPFDFDPGTRDRFLAGTLVPAHYLVQAQRMRAWFRTAVARVFEDVDVILTAATPVPATLIGQTMMELGGEQVPARPFMGVLTQPISCIGLPVAVAPLQRAGGLPLGIQLIGAPWREDHVLRVAAALEAAGVASSPVAAGALL
jgi:AtzE family amidohydrolase